MGLDAHDLAEEVKAAIFVSKLHLLTYMCPWYEQFTTAVEHHLANPLLANNPL